MKLGVSGVAVYLCDASHQETTAYETIRERVSNNVVGAWKVHSKNSSNEKEVTEENHYVGATGAERHLAPQYPVVIAE
jgi:hypothetical protein